MEALKAEVGLEIETAKDEIKELMGILDNEYAQMLNDVEVLGKQNSDLREIVGRIEDNVMGLEETIGHSGNF
jgi:archaellum component FlaC